MKKNNLDEILQDVHTVAISGHIRPDGDCVGSCMGMYLYLTDNYPDLSVDVYLEEIPKSFHILKNTEVIRHSIDPNQVYDLFICQDCSGVDRLGFSGLLFEKAGKTFIIDHHISGKPIADYNFIVPEASSASELVYQVLDETKISQDCAQALYMGIAHDTGIFQYSCTAPETMEAAASLMRKGIDISDLIDKTYYEKTYVQNQILGRALIDSMLLLNGKCIVSALTKADMKAYDAIPADLEGIVSQLRLTKGCEVAVFLYEIDEPKGYKISLRSKGAVDVAKVAQYFGGGGHVRAAGFSMGGSQRDIVSNIIGQLQLQLPGNGDENP